MDNNDFKKVFFKSFAQKVKEGKSENKVFLSINNGYIIGELLVDDNIESAIMLNNAILCIENKIINANDHMVFYDGIIGFSVYNEATFPKL